jgi:PST family polysaccharide transporter
MNHKLKSLIHNNKKIIENFSYLSILQVFIIFLPLLTYPYLIRTLGIELYGSVIFAQTIIAYFSIIINYGFDASITKDISIHRNDKVKISEIITSVYSIKIIFWLLLLLILIVAIYIIPFFKSRKLLYLFTFTMTFHELLFPIWYFQGMEKMKYITYINIFIRMIFVVSIFIFIKRTDDYIYVSLLHGLGSLFGGIAALYIVFVKDGIKLSRQPIQKLLICLKNNLPLFISNIIISVKDKFNVILIGSFLGMHDVAVYDLGIKIMTIFMQPIGIANNAIYPKIAKEQNKAIAKKFIKLCTLAIVCIIIFVQPFLGFILNYLSDNLEGVVLVTRILLLSPIICAISISLAYCIMAFGKYKYLFTSALFTTLFYIFIISVSVFLKLLNSIYTFVFIAVLIYLFELIYRLYICQKKIFK